MPGNITTSNSSPLEPVSYTHLVDEDIEIADVEVGENEYLYVFTFVGVITIEGRVLKCYPKYLLDATAPKAEPSALVSVLLWGPWHQADISDSISAHDPQSVSYTHLFICAYVTGKNRSATGKGSPSDKHRSTNVESCLLYTSRCV